MAGSTFKNVHEMWHAIRTGGKNVTELEKEKKILEAKLAGAEHEKQAKTLIVLEIYPTVEDKTDVSSESYDLAVLANGIKQMEHVGIHNWGEETKIEDVAFGIKKLTLSVTVYNTLVGVDDLFQMINKKYGNVVKSIEVVAMSKV
uniref:Translation elongation factor EF1B beta/delta subunit guanine nucleotide exchange domain-containing protein n=1 Tax=Aplanochytrium stocchinoi TaxID=215587 RepID=A0A7S3PT71_9STRA|mmetsp:Transcript_15097/g.18668  ORF Transcript_15097/g.18668 Transcript_15097/m.18668 type:complete len:145 (+) Transcript_15097:208-642(+)|eukprot:CAMPEP_0204829250 /NCGR_PEP_ID=MMETSP1346-20131115/7337_1 /ASSEMBLY_ACC=CAM_ASM_000771 /TAXON_ID=215587 /ORGANISM="Aplanochytrium stocchinoi, Strain GSBS06" /LENGTH=144 /DNA_ID=CAMNT_0051958883 /DNA_START=167 /DNA_END=601 /DNA_ORIENTATION=-